MTNHFSLNKNVFIFIVVACCLSLYFCYYSFFGEKGFLVYLKINQELQNREIIKTQLEEKMQTQKNLVKGMSLESLDLDLLDEEARRNLGYAGKEEIVIYNDSKESSPK